jgi:poly(hydroxyalkanoate) depolymerase family esterase
MFETRPRGLREALGLIGAGRLMEATAAIQRNLGGQAEAPAATQNRSASAPPIIDGTADWVDNFPMKLFGRNAEAQWDPAPEAPPMDLRRHRYTPSQGSQFLSLTFTGSAGSRPYKLYVPGGYRAGQPVPLIVMLHGCTQSPDDFAAGTRMNEVAERQNILVAYPGQTAAANMQKCWNWFNEDDQQRNAGEPCLIAGITRQIMAEYSVDPQKVFVAGLSAGGAAAAIMGSAYPELYAAVGVHSGLACGAASNMQSAFTAMRHGVPGDEKRDIRVVPSIIFHGDQDKTVNPRNGDFVAEQLAGRAAVSKQSEEGKVPGGHAYHRIVSLDAGGRTVAEQWVIHGAGHAWAGGSSSGSYTDPHGPNATEEMVRFFMEHPQTSSEP